MLYNLGKLMQIAALLLLPAAMVMQLAMQPRANVPFTGGSVSLMLLMLGFGIALFALGRYAEGFGKS